MHTRARAHALLHGVTRWRCSRLGCVTCGIGAGMGVSVPSCAVSCAPFNLQASETEILFIIYVRPP